MQDVEESLIALPHATDLISKANDHFNTFHGLLPSTIDAYAFGQTCRPRPCCSPPAGTARCHCRPTARFLRVVSLEHPTEFKEGMAFAPET
jgi:hypothetical protein